MTSAHQVLTGIGNRGLEMGVEMLLRCFLTGVTGSEVRTITLKKGFKKLKSVSSLFDYGLASTHSSANPGFPGLASSMVSSLRQRSSRVSSGRL